MTDHWKIEDDGDRLVWDGFVELSEGVWAEMESCCGAPSRHTEESATRAWPALVQSVRDAAEVRRLREDHRAAVAMVDDVRESLADAYAAGVRGPLVDDLIACLGHPGEPSGVPVGGGEPQPTTSTDNDRPVCDGFAWLGQPLTSCDTCGHPAWEHAGPHTGWPGKVRPWEPGELEAIRAKWDPSLVRSTGAGDSSGKRCPTCANAGWVGSRSNPDDCPTCGRKPYWTVGDGTYPSPLPVRSAGGGDQPDTPCPECGGARILWDPASGRDYVPCPACADKENTHGR